MKSINVRVLNFDETGLFETPFYIFTGNEEDIDYYITNTNEYNRYACDISSDFLGTDLWIEFENNDLKHYLQNHDWINNNNGYIKLTIEEKKKEKSESRIKRLDTKYYLKLKDRIKTLEFRLDHLIDMLHKTKIGD